MRLKLGVIGAPIEHSLSPNLHHAWARQAKVPLTYDKIEPKLECFDQRVRDFFHAGGTGLSVTAPFKLNAFQLANQSSDAAKRSQAANTLWINPQTRQIYADNTDGAGLIMDLSCKHIALQESKILILGSGGAVQTILPSILAENPRFVGLWGRTSDRAEKLMQTLKRDNMSLVRFVASYHEKKYDVIFNATGLDTHFDLSLVLGSPLIYDLSYHPSGLTPLVQQARAKGRKGYDGFGMLVAQARLAFNLFCQVNPLGPT